MRRPRKTVLYKVSRSTQDAARRLAERGAPDATLVVAERQTSGRGRLGRRWVSGKGGVYFSLILRPRFDPRRLAALSLAAGAALARALGEESGLQTRVKPPNDVLARGASAGSWKKVAGILLEARTDSGGRLDWLIAGVGVNVHNRIPPEIAAAASLSALAGRRLDASRVLERAVSAVLEATHGIG